MQSFRIKFGERRNDWRCCFCCHVRTGTIFYGTYRFTLNLMAFTALTLMVHNQRFDLDTNPVLPTPLSEIDDDFHELYKPRNLIQEAPKPSIQYKLFYSPSEWNITLFYTMCTLFLSLCLLYGAIKRKPSYLMPFFVFEVFNFCIACMTTVHHYAEQPNYQEILQRTNLYPLNDELRNVNLHTLTIYATLAALFVLMLKAYFIGVIWSCYKYLSSEQQMLSQRTIHLIEANDNRNLVVNDLPDYDTAVKKFPAPPPSYATAVLGEQEASATATASASRNQQDAPPTVHQV